MKLKFKKYVAAGAINYAAGKEYDVADQHAAEVYVAHGYAVAVDGTQVGRTTLGATKLNPSGPGDVLNPIPKV